MTLEEYLVVFRNEASVLPHDEQQELNRVLLRKIPREIFLCLNEQDATRFLNPQKFVRTLNDFYGQFC
jgi:hypothetical protein